MGSERPTKAWDVHEHFTDLFLGTVFAGTKAEALELIPAVAVGRVRRVRRKDRKLKPPRYGAAVSMQADPEGGYIDVCATSAIIDQAKREERQRLREALKEPIHVLASTIGRARVFADNDEPKLARRELDCAADAMGRLRDALTFDSLDVLEANPDV